MEFWAQLGICVLWDRQRGYPRYLSMAQWTPFPAQRVSPLTHSTQRGAPDLVGLLLNGIHSALHRTQQGPDLAGCLLEQEACHKLIHAAATLVHLWRRTGVGASLGPWDHGIMAGL